MTNPRYASTVQRLRDEWTDTVLHPIDETVHYIEKVIKMDKRGRDLLPRIQPYGAQLNAITYFHLDLMAIVAFFVYKMC